LPSIRPCELPPDALLARYSGAGGYADCFTTEIPGTVSHAEYVEAFYTGRVFKLERLLLKVFLSKPCTDAQVRELAAGRLDHFSAWSVEGRATDQILLRALDGRTRSWLMVAPVDGSSVGTRLYFGSAVIPVADKKTGKRRMGFLFTALLGFHKLYSRVLLASACARLARGRD
jgi:hypothetical protein